MWIICKSKGWSNQVINLCIIYTTPPMVYMSDLNEGCMQNKNLLKVLNYSNDTVFLTHVYLSVLYLNKSFYLSKVRHNTIVNNIHDKTIQWETRKKSCSIIKLCKQNNTVTTNPYIPKCGSPRNTCTLTLAILKKTEK